MERRIVYRMTLVEITVTEEQRITLLDLVAGLLKADLEALRQVALEGIPATYVSANDDRKDTFFRAGLEMLAGEAPGLFLALQREQLEEALEALEEPTEEEPEVAT